MKLQTLQALVHVEELGSIRAAAQRMAMSQPALTAAIQQLEDELHTPLLVRTRQGASLTPFGQAFMGHARLIVSEARRAREQIDQMRGTWEGSIRFSTSPAVALSVLPLALPHFHDKYPGVQVHCRDGLYPGVTPSLRDGTLDFALTPVNRPQVEADLSAEPLFVTEVVIVCRPGHPLREATRLADLAGCRWVYSSDAPGPGAMIEQAFASAGLAPPLRGLTCESFLALPGIVARSDFVATVPRLLFEHPSFCSELREVPIAHALPTPTVHVLRRHDLPLTPAAQHLIGWIRHYALRKGPAR
jgi:DNA-binding transcriptional LysR family regulator